MLEGAERCTVHQLGEQRQSQRQNGGNLVCVCAHVCVCVCWVGVHGRSSKEALI